MTYFMIISAIIVAATTGYSIYLLYKNKGQLAKTPGLMISIAISTMAGLLSGTITGILSGEMFLVVGISMIIGFMVGFLAGHPIGLLAIVMSSIFGLLGGIIGAILGVLLIFINPIILLGILLGLFIVIIGLVILFILADNNQKYSVQTEELSPFAIIAGGVVFASLFLFLYSSNWVEIPVKTEAAQAEASQTKTTQPAARAEIDVTDEATPKVKMLVTDRGYAPNVIRVKKGAPVELEIQNPGDNSCFSKFNMPDFNINNADLKIGTTTLTFMPDKTGEYTFSCGMNMFKGTVIVE
ncbi:cupredoxin domain-containing protein [Neobacillus niacini]|uniref:cupredoxin domain-containing protein n=1 Tax=Neobacillus niacini TaxID=86668 RepID=UPI0021CB36C1|nr:cupredoxin domain-containing protein [Neobacillus niacini]MCM3764272.1 cupredoxin domain-containing protein [Neobacillus niacini]